MLGEQTVMPTLQDKENRQAQDLKIVNIENDFLM